jgi:hypothetical protein
MNQMGTHQLLHSSSTNTAEEASGNKVCQYIVNCKLYLQKNVFLKLALADYKL